MRVSLFAFAALAAGCAADAPHPYPDSVRQAFDAQCSGGADFCACAWDGLTRAMTAEEYEAAQARFAAEGLMDPRITRVRTRCRGQAL